MLFSAKQTWELNATGHGTPEINGAFSYRVLLEDCFKIKARLLLNCLIYLEQQLSMQSWIYKAVFIKHDMHYGTPDRYTSRKYNNTALKYILYCNMEL